MSINTECYTSNRIALTSPIRLAIARAQVALPLGRYHYVAGDSGNSSASTSKVRAGHARPGKWRRRSVPRKGWFGIVTVLIPGAGTLPGPRFETQAHRAALAL